MGNNDRPMLELVDVHKSFGDVEVLKGISASVPKGELLTFVGPSGCGKTTLLRIIGGFTSITSGQILLDGEDIASLPPNMRDTKMVFQSYALFPHMNVRKNIGFGLKLQKMPPGQIDDRVDELLSLVHMDGLGERTIERISGGQQQRVALARSLALEPKVLLLDEPLSNLDANLRVVMRDEIRSIQERIGITTIFVTHDQYEAMSISDRILVLNDKIIQQIGSPSDIYETPVNQFIAEFVGYVNFLEGKIESFDQDSSGVFLVTTEYGDIALDKIDKANFDKGDEVLLVIRPETVTLFPSDAEDLPNMLTGKIKDSMYAGNFVKYTIKCGDREILIDQYNPRDSIKFRRGDSIKFTVPRTVHALPKK
ncbi:MAG: ABC transporter ATP-binding protein [Deltaproteobacteria bacterium]|nr:ABC transporter ATP-binding protein [Deltaproteobacteria bacterium]